MDETQTQCESRVNNLQCGREAGHEGPHFTDFDLPPDLAMIVGESMEEIEQMSIAYSEAQRGMIQARRWLLFACGFNIACGIWNLVGIFT